MRSSTATRSLNAAISDSDAPRSPSQRLASTSFLLVFRYSVRTPVAQPIATTHTVMVNTLILSFLSLVIRPLLPDLPTEGYSLLHSTCCDRQSPNSDSPHRLSSSQINGGAHNDESLIITTCAYSALSFFEATFARRAASAASISSSASSASISSARLRLPMS